MPCSQYYFLLLLRVVECVVPCGLVVRIRRSHRRGRGSIPRMGGEIFFFYTPSPFALLLYTCIHRNFSQFCHLLSLAKIFCHANFLFCVKDLILLLPILSSLFYSLSKGSKPVCWVSLMSWTRSVLAWEGSWSRWRGPAKNYRKRWMRCRLTVMSWKTNSMLNR